jgi:PST family polysaccharide transporter
MNGLGRFPSYAKINVISAVWQMAWVALFLYTGKLSVLLIIATESIIASLFALIIASKAGFSFNAIKHTVLDIRKPWVSFALMGLVPMILTPLVLTLVRSFIGLKLGFDAAGIWQGIWKISDFFASIFSAIIGVILLPKISSSLTKEKFNEIFYPTFLKFIAIVTGIIFCVFIFRSQVILLMLSNKYIGAADYIPYQLIGDFFRSISWCFGFVLMAKLKTKSFIAIETFSQLFFAIATYFGILFFGFYGPIFAYALENFISLILLLIAFKGIKWNSI